VTKVPMKDIVIILPGIMGSVLQKDGKDLWVPSVNTLLRGLNPLGRKFQDLKLEGDDPNGGDIEDGIKPTRMMTDTYLIPGFSGFGQVVDGYNRLSDQITKNFSNIVEGNIYDDPAEKAGNFYHFPYDWRRDNRANAHILKRLLDIRLKRWREFSGNKDAKAILLAHSMGGLVSRYYLETLGGWQDCRALFTFGTPYRGSVNALNLLANGMKKGPLNLGAIVGLDAVIPTLTSVYQLLPRYRALKVGEKYYRVAQSPEAIPGVDLDKAKDALKFHNEIDDAADVNQENAVYLKSFVTCPVVGSLQPTMQSAKLSNGVISVAESLPDWLSDRTYLSDGDGTVPQVSATPVQMDDRDKLAFVDYISESHGALQNQPTVLLNLLRGIQTAQAPSSGDVRSAVRGVAKGTRSNVKGIGLRVEDLFLAKEPVTLRAKVAGNAAFSALTAEIKCVSAERPVITQGLVNEAGDWTMAMEPLAAGLYKVKVQTDNRDDDAPSPVHGLFSVTDLSLTDSGE